MQSYHITFVIMGLLFLACLPGMLSSPNQRPKASAAMKNSVWENIFDQRRLKVIRHFHNRKGEFMVEYVVDGSQAKASMPYSLMTNQYKQISKPKYGNSPST